MRKLACLLNMAGATRMIMVLAGLLLGLSLTSPWLWWSRVSKRRGVRARRSGAIVDPTASGT